MTAVRAAVADVDPVRLSQIVTSVRKVPSHYREFTQTADVARDVHRIPAALLRTLTAHGLPKVGAADEALFDERDLANVSAGLGLRSAWYFGQRGWTAALEQLGAGGQARFEIGVRPRCPYPGHLGECQFSLWLADDEAAAEPSECAVGTMTGPGTATVQTGQPPVVAPAAVAQVLDAVTGIDYLNLPVELEQDLDFFCQAKVANCSLAAAAVARAARVLGVRVRRSFGLVMLPPYAGLHNWVEFSVDGRWTVFDPHLIGYLETAGVLRPGWWPKRRSIGGLLLRLGPANASTSLATHFGLHTEVSFAVRRAR